MHHVYICCINFILEFRLYFYYNVKRKHLKMKTILLYLVSICTYVHVLPAKMIKLKNNWIFLKF